MVTVDERNLLRATFADHAATMQSRAPVWSEVSRRIASTPEAEGVLTALLAAPSHQRRPVLAMAALHELALRHPHEPLAGHLADLAQRRPTPEEVWTAVTELLSRHQDEFCRLVSTRSTQTNEVGRCAVLIPALAAVDDEVGPLGLVELGCSAGLLLNLDRYDYRYRSTEQQVMLRGHREASPDVELSCAVRAHSLPALHLPRIASRVGVDPQPVGVDDEDDVRWLQACVWPDQTDRLAVLRQAIAVARRWPVPVVRDDGVDRVPVELDQAAGHPVLVSSWALTYVPPERRSLLLARLDDLAQRRDLTMVLFEDPALIPEFPVPRLPDDRDLTVLAVIRWRSGRRHEERWGTAHPHGYWWRPES